MEEFYWGSATASYQCEGGWKEGGKGLSNWDVFTHSEKNYINPVTGDVSSDFYHRYEEDIKMLAEGGQNAFRFSIAWTRIIPEGTGEISREGIDFYNRVIDTCIKYNVEPFVTLYHWDMPIALFEAGGWENRLTVKAFEQYAKTCFEEFGDRVNYWTTMNEPGYETMCSYGIGNYPPNIKDLNRRWKAVYHIMLASARSVKIYRNLKLNGKIGLVNDSYSIETMVDNKEYQEAANYADMFYNRSINDLCVFGELPEDFLNKLKQDGYDLSYVNEKDNDDFKLGIVDFLGVNAYSRILVKPYTDGETSLYVNNTGKEEEVPRQIVKNWFEIDEDPDQPVNPWGMEIYPKSIFTLLMNLKDRYSNIPIVITENGVGYYDKVVDGKIDDDYRIEYLKGFIDWIIKAKEKGCNVQGYFVWSTMDLYSWINGYDKRYGLVYVDFDNQQKRIPKASYYWYKDYINKNRGKVNE